MLTNDTLLFYAERLRNHCRELASCKYCIFDNKNEDRRGCILDEEPQLWRLEESKHE